jgi:hypothetical protein
MAPCFQGAAVSPAAAGPGRFGNRPSLIHCYFAILLKTKDFANDIEVAALVAAFETGSIAAAEFTHAAHIAVALSYLAESPPDQALSKMRESIRAFAAYHNVGNLYHETLTTFWMRLLDHVGRTYSVAEPDENGRRADLPLWRRINLIVARWGNSLPVQAHYSRKLIASDRARKNYVPPDRSPLPF